MNVLLDTHALFWWFMADRRLSPHAKLVIDDLDNHRYVSSVSVYELANKHRIGKLDASEILASFEAVLSEGGFRVLPITVAHAKLAGEMPGHHRDPFDRLLAAQCKLENLSLLTVDAAFSDFGIDIVW